MEGEKQFTEASKQTIVNVCKGLFVEKVIRFTSSGHFTTVFLNFTKFVIPTSFLGKTYFKNR